jgi:hypothetical protein
MAAAVFIDLIGASGWSFHVLALRALRKWYASPAGAAIIRGVLRTLWVDLVNKTVGAPLLHFSRYSVGPADGKAGW